MTSEDRPPEQPQTEAIVIPPHIIRPFAHGLDQLLTEPLKQIDAKLSNRERTTTGNYNEPEEAQTGFDQLKKFVTDLKTARVVTLKQPDPDHWTLILSDEKDDEATKPQAGEVIIDTVLSRQLGQALGHHAGNMITAPIGFALILDGDDINGDLHKAASHINDLLKPFEGYKDLNQIRIVTDDDGNTTLTPVFQELAEEKETA